MERRALEQEGAPPQPSPPPPGQSHHGTFVMHLSAVCQEDSLLEEGEGWGSPRTWLKSPTPVLLSSPRSTFPETSLPVPVQRAPTAHRPSDSSDTFPFPHSHHRLIF